jgi:hypothetical protein
MHNERWLVAELRMTLAGTSFLNDFLARIVIEFGRLLNRG